MSERRYEHAEKLLVTGRRLNELVAMAEINDRLEQWRVFFRSELDLVQRARNNLVWCEWIGQENLEAAVRIATTLLRTGEEAAAR